MKMAKLTRLESTHNNLRTNEVYGTYLHPPVVEHTFQFMAKPLNPRASVRLIETSLVTKVEEFTDKIRFTTENSTYELEHVHLN